MERHFEGILASLKTIPATGVVDWNDVNRFDVRPGRGVVKAWLNSWEWLPVPGPLRLHLLRGQIDSRRCLRVFD